MTAARSAGTKKKVASSVAPRLRRRSVPKVAVPRSAESASEPKAVPVVRAEKRIARAVAEVRNCRPPVRQFITK